eukprot:snap_masked-scaffold_8-processed-gene-8.37-mRNA-1 protein AED:1.00 eAED:1.00 QI:0/0/0/0/1/1/2/0/195
MRKSGAHRQQKEIEVPTIVLGFRYQQVFIPVHNISNAWRRLNEFDRFLPLLACGERDQNNVYSNQEDDFQVFKVHLGERRFGLWKKEEEILKFQVLSVSWEQLSVRLKVTRSKGPVRKDSKCLNLSIFRSEGIPGPDPGILKFSSTSLPFLANSLDGAAVDKWRPAVYYLLTFHMDLFSCYNAHRTQAPAPFITT